MNSLGLNSYDAASFNDDRLGRCLDKLANSNRKMISFRLALRIIKIFELNCQHVHQDTTSITDQYYSTKTNYETDCGRRLIWIKSSQKTEIDQNIRTERIEKTLTSIQELNTKLNKYKLKKLKNIKKAINDILHENKMKDLVQFKIRRHFVVKKSYLKSGRPKPDSPIKMQRKISYSLSYWIDQEELIKQRRIDGIFPLLTNNRDKSDKEILQTYKNQSFLENRNSQLKTYLEVAPVFLKNAKRVLALLDIVILSLSIATLMERDLRMGMKRQEIKSIPIYPEKRESKYPTAHSIIYAFRNVEKYEFRNQNHKITEYFPPELSPLQKQIINLMELPVSIYE